MKIFKLALIFLQCFSFASLTFSQSATSHYRIYDGHGKPMSLDELIAVLKDYDVCFVGEVHDDPVAHLFESQILRRAFDRYSENSAPVKRPLAVSLEMFERDVQSVLDEYLAGQITEHQMLLSTRPWSNYSEDYRPLIEFAREHKLPVIAANAPERYVNRVARLGPNSLSELSPAARALLPHLPYAPASSQYAAKFQEVMSGEIGLVHISPPADGKTAPGGEPDQNTRPASSPHSHPGHGLNFLLDAQNLRDASMAYSISQYLNQQPGALLLQFNGAFHSEGRLGAPEQLARYSPHTRVLVVTIVSGSGSLQFTSETMANLGDFVVVTDTSRTKSF